ncbi:MAG: CpaE-like family protein, partial [Actinomycetota bacterium]|nr:CpaE-like family protein [Actinomycetota bacterium]
MDPLAHRSGRRRPLVVTAEPDLLDDLLRLAAAAGAELDVAPDAAGARRCWEAAPLVLVGADAAPGCARARLPRRGHVVLVGDDLDDGSVWETAVRVGAEHVVFLPDAEPWVTERMADAAEGAGPEGVLVATVGGRGGAGATSLSCALAVTAARTSRRTLLVDGDPLGGGLDLCFGREQDPGLRWPELARTRGRMSATALSEALPRVDQLSVLSWDRGSAETVPAEAVQAVLHAGLRTCDLVVVDLPRTLDEGSRAVLDAATTVLLVVPAEVRAAAAASRVAGLVRPHCRDLRAVVRGPAPSGLQAGEIARALGVPLAGELRPEPGLE